MHRTDLLGRIDLRTLEAPEDVTRAHLHARPNTPAPLGPFRRSLLVRPAPPQTYRQLVSETVREVFRQPATTTLLDTQPERIKVCYRLVREFIRMKGAAGPDDTLLGAPEEFLTSPTEDKKLLDTLQYLQDAPKPTNHLYVHICKDALRLREQYWCPTETRPTYETEVEASYFEAPKTTKPTTPTQQPKAGLPFLPPQVPKYFLDPTTNAIKDIYDTDHDPLLRLYTQAISVTADYLGLYDMETSARGMEGLLQPELTRLAFATKEELIAWEYILITNTLDCLVKHGSHRTHKTLINTHNFTHHEATGMLQLAKRFATSLVDSDRTNDRALVLLRCEDMMRTSRKALDQKSHLNVLKQMSAVLGLTRTEEEGELGDVVAMVKQHTQQRETNALFAAKPQNLLDDTESIA